MKVPSWFHQCGYFWSEARRLNKPVGAAMLAAGLAALVLLVTIAGYPASMVTVGGETPNNAGPPTVVLFPLVLAQLGLVLLTQRALERWLKGPLAWAAIVAMGRLTLSIYLWHVTALILAVVAVHGSGLWEPTEVDAFWWAMRPLWRPIARQGADAPWTTLRANFGDYPSSWVESSTVPYGSVELLGKRDDDALRTPDIAQSILVFIVRYLANEFRAMGAQAPENLLDVLDREHDAAYAERVRRRVLRLRTDCRWPQEPHQLKPRVAVRSPHHCDVEFLAVEPDNAVGPPSLDSHFALQLETQFDEEGDGACEVVDNNADIVHPLKRHVPNGAHRTSKMFRGGRRRGPKGLSTSYNHMVARPWRTSSGRSPIPRGA